VVFFHGFSFRFSLSMVERRNDVLKWRLSTREVPTSDAAMENAVTIAPSAFGMA